MGKIFFPEELNNFRDKDLTLQVRLETCVSETAIDFTGKKSYNFGLYKQGIGFGITNIDIEVNPSLQPVIDITFKDLYGNTVFGTQNSSSGLDYSVLFNWPPPKFYFTFKGYLGSPVTWILNLKKINTSFNSTDSTYEIKTTFVPNQWGFFSDIPFLYLLGIKGLKKNFANSSTQFNSNNKNTEVQTIFDYIKLGKRVDTKKIENSKEFDTLKKQVTSAQGSLVNAINSTKVIVDNIPVTGKVGNNSIIGFNDFVFIQPDWLTPDAVKSITTTAAGIDKLNDFLLVKCVKFSNSTQSKSTTNANLVNVSPINTSSAAPAEPSSVDLSNAKSIVTSEGISKRDFDIYNSNDNQNKNLKNSKLDILKNNLKLIEDAIQQRFFNTTKTELSKLTISEIFKRLAGDTAYLLGKILEAGIQGIANNNQRKNGELSKNLIGEGFPLINLPSSEKSEEVPALDRYLPNSAGVDQYEMQFVRDFIRSVSEGIAENKDFQDNAENSITQDSILTKRVNNLEMLQGNPYAADYTNIAGNILLRSAIIGYFTRSNNPNRPGDYDTITNIDRDSVGEITELAQADIQNISTQKIADLTDDDRRSLKRFCNFFTKLFTSDGNFNTDAIDSTQKQIIPILQQSKEQKIPSDILNFRVKITNESEDITTVNDFFNNTIDSILTVTNKSMVDSSYYKENKIAKRFYNNNLPWFFPSVLDNKYTFLLFEGENATNAASVNSSSTDDSDRGDNPDDKINKLLNISVGTSDPLGFVPVSQYSIEVDGKKTITPRVKYLNDKIKDGLVYKYSEFIENPQLAVAIDSNTISSLNPTYSEVVGTDFIQTDLLGDPKDLHGHEIPAENLGYIIFTHTFDEDGLNDAYSEVAWGLFLGDFQGFNAGPGRGQRVALYSMCQSLLAKMDSYETKKSNAVGEVLSKANEEENTIYKQFHVIFNQWNLLASQDLSDYNFAGNNFCGLTKTADGLAEELERQYTANHSTIGKNDEILPENVAFRYDYPLNSVNDLTPQIKVENSIINIDSLYASAANTTVLNIIQQICQKNNFMFIPIPGNGSYRDIRDVYTPNPTAPKLTIRNYFHVLFVPTPESRVYSNTNNSKDNEENKKKIGIDAIGIRYGSIDNKIIKSINVGTEDNKPTAESIVNLQRLVSNENKNKVVTRDCSTLSVVEGRSYKATINMLGNAQIYPMQYFFIDRSPIFSGLYQIMRVSHSITPNDMNTTAEGIRMSFAGGTYGGVPPITLDTLSKISVLEQPAVPSGQKDGQISSNITSQRPTNSLVVGPSLSTPKDGMISKHVSFAKAIFSSKNVLLGVTNEPNNQELDSMKYVAQNIYDKIADHFGAKNLNINSFFRSKPVNDAVGSTDTSWHRKGAAIDISSISNKFNNSDIYFYIKNNLPFTELIWEYGTDSNPNWVHVAYAKGREQDKKYFSLPKGTPQH